MIPREEVLEILAELEVELAEVYSLRDEVRGMVRRAARRLFGEILTLRLAKWTVIAALVVIVASRM